MLNPDCLMAKEEFGTVVATGEMLAQSNMRTPTASALCILGMNAEAFRATW
ncbi:hypothetical protein [Giesbergeria giesbergeri]|uniref:Uncharacterized protein n=1 Tax=Giesbergeria sinuosa TaxID=80883 RepID=A0ABV9QE73_9BURK